MLRASACSSSRGETCGRFRLQEKLEETSGAFPGRTASLRMNQSLNERVKEKTGPAVADVLQPILADERSLSAVTRSYRRDVRGPNSLSLQKLFDDQWRQIDCWLAQLLQSAPVTEHRGDGVDRLSGASLAGESLRVDVPASLMIQDLLGRHELLSQRLRAEATQGRDSSTLHLLQRLAEFHDTAAWILRVVINGHGPVGLEENCVCSAPDPSGRV